MITLTTLQQNRLVNVIKMQCFGNFSSSSFEAKSLLLGFMFWKIWERLLRE